MAEGHLIRGIMFSNEQIDNLEKQGLTGKLLDLHLSYSHILNLYSSALGCYDVYMVIFKARHRTEKDTALPVHHFRDFFNLVEQSLRNNAISCIFKLIDNNTKSLSLKVLLEDIEANKDLFKDSRYVSEIVAECRNELNKVPDNKDVNDLIKYRHKYVAHLDNKMTCEEYYLANMNYLVGTPRKVINVLRPIFEKLHPIFDSNDLGSIMYFQSSSNEALQVLSLLSKFLVREE